jgi:hypothetical protein
MPRELPGEPGASSSNIAPMVRSDGAGIPTEALISDAETVFAPGAGVSVWVSGVLGFSDTVNLTVRNQKQGQ